ncbi:MAG TPA: DNA gyrase modulator, partial [Coxiellaceae bacterium]|nr:DNA gyrase modulator [Coxiellaceae bacterium]
MTEQNSLLKLDEYQEIAAKTLAFAEVQGANQAEVHLDLSEGFSVNVRREDVETLEHTREKNLSVTVYIDQATGTATSSDLSEASLQAAVTKACDIARYTN